MLEDGSPLLVPTRALCEQHVVEDFGFIPEPEDWLSGVEPRTWMLRSLRLGPYDHAQRSARKWGGGPEDYEGIHRFLDVGFERTDKDNFHHRVLRHHAAGIFECEEVYGPTLRLSTGRVIPVRWVAEQHVVADLRTIPAASDWLSCITPACWMTRSRRLSEELEEVA